MPLSYAAKRLLDQSGPGLPRKRARMTTTVVVRGKKAEMKYFDTPITYVATSGTNQLISDVPQGTTVSDRVGNKIKVYAIEYFVNCPAASPVRLDFIRLKDPTVLPAHGYNALVLPSAFDRLKTITMHDGTLLNRAGCYGVHKLKMGNVIQFTGSTGATRIRNPIIAYLSTPASQTITGQFRIWYTDA